MQEGKLRKALNKIKFDDALRALDIAEPMTPSEGKYVVDSIIHSGCLICKAEGVSSADRAAFVSAVKDHVAAYAGGATRKRLREHLSQVDLLNELYTRLLALLDEGAIARHSVAEQVWAAIIRTSQSSEIVRARLTSALKQGAIRLGQGSLTIPSSESTNGANTQIDADSAINMLADAVFATLQMLGYREKWFRDGILTIPSPVPIDDGLVFKTGFNTLLASIWLAVENADEHGSILSTGRWRPGCTSRPP